MTDKVHNIALFIDGDNVCRSTFQENFDEIKLKGRICIKRIYFDFNEKLDEKWKSIILSNGIESISVINLPTKNSTDIRLMLDMIKEFYSNPIIDTYIIMSSDSDFYHIATFLRSCGKKVICYGEKHTPPMLTNVCDEFILCRKKNILNNININKKDNPEQNQQIINIEEEQIYQEMKNLDPYYIQKSEIKNTKWNNYPYYVEYKNKIYIIREVINTIKLIYVNKNIINKNLSSLKDLLIRSDSSFSEKNWGFNSFRIFIESLLPNIIKTTYNSDKRVQIITEINI